MQDLHYGNAGYDALTAPYVYYSEPPVESNVVSHPEDNNNRKNYFTSPQGNYERCSYSVKYAFVDQALSKVEGIYEYDTELNTSPYEVAVSVEEEQKIYETPCDDDEDVGPIYCEPPSEEEELYAIFEGKQFQKLYHKDIRYGSNKCMCNVK